MQNTVFGVVGYVGSGSGLYGGSVVYGFGDLSVRLVSYHFQILLIIFITGKGNIVCMFIYYACLKEIRLRDKACFNKTLLLIALEEYVFLMVIAYQQGSLEFARYGWLSQFVCE